MRRALQTIRTSVLFALLASASPLMATDVTWDGGDGTWDEAKWNGGKHIDEFLDVLDGAEGWKRDNEGEMDNVTIGQGSTVEYLADDFSADFEMFQGSTLTINEGAVWVQSQNDDWLENRWTEMDLSVLNLDNGTFRRTGAVNDEGGGALLLGSWQGDDTFGKEGSPDHQEIIINLTNGGRLENEGQLWFGSWDDTPPNGTIVTVNINDGAIDLTGGDVEIEAFGNADLVFTNKYAGTEFEEDLPTYTINFTGPGSITVDESGILNMSCIDFDQDANNCLDWSDDDPVTYQQLWDVGILQANGVTGPDGDFDQFFSVSGSLGQADYTVNSKVGGLRGDFNNDQVVNATDIDLLSAEVVAGTNNSAFDLNSDGAVNQADRTEWIDVINNTYVGDSDLNGVFDSGDFVKVFSAGQYEDDIAGNSTWETGDWNGDTEFDSGDFVAAFSAGGYDKGPRPVNAVPEPSGIAILIVGCLALLRARTR